MSWPDHDGSPKKKTIWGLRYIESLHRQLDKTSSDDPAELQCYSIGLACIAYSTIVSGLASDGRGCRWNFIALPIPK